MTRYAIGAAAIAAIATATAPQARAQGARISAPVELAHAVEQLKPGEWVWAPEISPRGPLTIYVDLSVQRAMVYRNGVLIGVSTISSGKPGHETPTGVFSILQKDPAHRSSKYNNAPMPFTQRLTWDGVALHAGGLPGYPESHGCVHLPLSFSKALFQVTALGGTVVIAGSAGRPLAATNAGVLQPAAAKGTQPGGWLTDDTAYYWAPGLSTAGPITIVMSRADQIAVVMRNGVEIGRSAIEIPKDVDETHVITLARGPDGKVRWIYVQLPGHDGAAREMTAQDTAPVRIPRGFMELVLPILEPGATILVTSTSIGGSDTGRKVTIMDAETPDPDAVGKPALKR